MLDFSDSPCMTRKRRKRHPQNQNSSFCLMSFTSPRGEQIQTPNRVKSRWGSRGKVRIAVDLRGFVPGRDHGGAESQADHRVGARREAAERKSKGGAGENETARTGAAHRQHRKKPREALASGLVSSRLVRPHRWIGISAGPVVARAQHPTPTAAHASRA